MKLNVLVQLFFCLHRTELLLKYFKGGAVLLKAASPTNQSLVGGITNGDVIFYMAS